MSQFEDPRLSPGFKNKPAIDRAMMLLGAILDQLIAANAKQAPVRKREKAE